MLAEDGPFDAAAIARGPANAPVIPALASSSDGALSTELTLLANGIFRWRRNTSTPLRKMRF